MYFNRVFKPNGYDRVYKFRFKARDGVVISGVQYEPDPDYANRAFIITQFSNTYGGKDFFLVKDKEQHGLPPETPIWLGRVQKPATEPLVELEIRGERIVLDQRQWRALRFHMDEAFLLQQQLV